MGIQQQFFENRNYTFGKELGISRIVSLLIVALPSRVIMVHLTNGKDPRSQVLLSTWTKEYEENYVMRPCLMFPNSHLYTCQCKKFFFCWHQEISLCRGSRQSFSSVGGTCLGTKPELASLFPLLVSY